MVYQVAGRILYGIQSGVDRGVAVGIDAGGLHASVPQVAVVVVGEARGRREQQRAEEKGEQHVR